MFSIKLRIRGFLFTPSDNHHKIILKCMHTSNFNRVTDGNIVKIRSVQIYEKNNINRVFAMNEKDALEETERDPYMAHQLSEKQSKGINITLRKYYQLYSSRLIKRPLWCRCLK